MFAMPKAPFWRSKYFLRTSAVLLVTVLVIGLVKPANAAIAYRSASSGNNAGGATSLTINTPSGAAVGDVLIASIDMRIAATGSFTISTPSGWQPIGTDMTTSVTKNFALYHVISSAPPSSYTFQLLDGGAAYSTKASGGMIAYSGVDASNPINATTVGSYASNATMNAPSITTTVPNAMIVALYGAATGTTATQGSSMIERFDDASTSNGAASRTTSAGQDVLQASAGATGQKTMTLASAAVHTARTVALTPAPVVSQVGYRWFANSTTAGTVGSPLAAQDTIATAPAAGQPFRLRMLLGITDAQLATSDAFKLQYSAQTTGSCSATGTYYDVTSSSPIRYYDNSGVSDAAAIVTSANDPVRSGVTKATQTYEESNNFTASTAVPAGQDGMWDFALTFSTNAAPTGEYCLKVVKSDGTALDTYPAVPGIRAQAQPSKSVQGSYRFSQNANSLTPGSAFAATNTPVTLGSANESFRLRMTARGYQGFSQISSGNNHTCGIASDNQAYCWGSNTNGQLGNGGVVGDQVSPVAVDTSNVLAGKTILSIAAGSSHTCAIASDYKAYCWGGDGNGQLGNGATTGNQVSPVAVDMSGVLNGMTILSIAVGTFHTCVVASNNQAYCWGFDGSGQLGNGAITGDQASPSTVSTGGVMSGKTILSISAGSTHTCAIASDNQAYCWGSDANGRLGNGATTGDQISPSTVDNTGVLSGKTIFKISAGSTHTCAVASDSQAYCWGSDTNGELGDGGSLTAQPSPVAVDTSGVLSGKTILSISSAMSSNTCAVASDNQAYCWGGDLDGQLGNGATSGNQLSPVSVDTSGVLSGKTITSISAGSTHNCVIASDNQAYCWGSDTNERLGNGATTGNQVSPVAVSNGGALAGKTILSMATGSNHTCAIASDNQAYCWGLNGSGQLGNGSITNREDNPVPVDRTGVLSGKTILSITAGNNHTCVIASDNLPYCWGRDAESQLGNGATTGIQDSPVAVDTTGVLSGKTVSSISAGVHHTCVIASDNLAYCWGYDFDGELGNGAPFGDQASPVAVDTTGVLSGKTILSIDAGGYQTCAIASDNLLYCWGLDAQGQVGDGGSATNQASPVAVNTAGVLSGKTILSIVGGAYHTCAIASDNLLYCWGRDDEGQLGNGAATTGNQQSPVTVDTTGALSGKTILSGSGGGYYTCVKASDNKAYCWGADDEGQLGNDIALSGQTIPVAVDVSNVLAGKDIVSVYAGFAQSCAIASDNLAYCWGNDASGQLGNGSITERKPTPIAVNLMFSSTLSVQTGRLLLTLQFAQKTLSSCAVQTGFAAITGSTSIAFNDNAGATSGAAITTSTANDPSSPGGNTPQTYHDLVDSVTNVTNLDGEGFGLWDFSLKDNGAPTSTTYCLRLAGEDGSALGAYSSFPEITTAAGGGGPADVNAGLLRGGQAVVDGIKQLFSW